VKMLYCRLPFIILFIDSWRGLVRGWSHESPLTIRGKPARWERFCDSSGARGKARAQQLSETLQAAPEVGAEHPAYLGFGHWASRGGARSRRKQSGVR
jgi:hypothetical protein